MRLYVMNDEHGCSEDYSVPREPYLPVPGSLSGPLDSRATRIKHHSVRYCTFTRSGGSTHSSQKCLPLRVLLAQPQIISAFRAGSRQQLPGG